MTSEAAVIECHAVKVTALLVPLMLLLERRRFHRGGYSKPPSPKVPVLGSATPTIFPSFQSFT